MVPVMPSFMAMTSQSVVRASYSAMCGWPLTMKVARSEVIGAGRATTAAPARMADSPPTTVSAIPVLADFRKFLRE